MKDCLYCNSSVDYMEFNPSFTEMVIYFKCGSRIECKDIDIYNSRKCDEASEENEGIFWEVSNKWSEVCKYFTSKKAAKKCVKDSKGYYTEPVKTKWSEIKDIVWARQEEEKSQIKRIQEEYKETMERRYNPNYERDHDPTR